MIESHPFLYFCTMKKIFRSLLYIIMMLGLALLPDLWLWFDAVSTWPLALAIAWWIPSALLLLAETGLQFGVYHRLSVRVLFTMILFSVMPKIVYILLSLFLPWWVAILPALFMIGGFIFGFTKGWRKLEVKQITYSSPDLPPYFDGYKILHFTDFHWVLFPKIRISWKKWWNVPIMKV